MAAMAIEPLRIYHFAFPIYHFSFFEIFEKYRWQGSTTDYEMRNVK